VFFLLYTSVLVVESLAYGITPWSLTLENHHRRPVYVVLRLISGGGVAILLGNIMVLSVRNLGDAKNHYVMGFLMTTEWVSGAGPSFAWVLHVLELQSGQPATQSCNAFFWICSGVAASAAVCVVALRRVQQKQTQEVARKADAEVHAAADQTTIDSFWL